MLPLSVKACGSIILINLILNLTHQQAHRKCSLQQIYSDCLLVKQIVGLLKSLRKH